MKVRIVCYEDVNLWILGKFARNMQEQLRALGVDIDIAQVPDANADINHHIIFRDYDGRSNGVDTLMITHVDNSGKLNQLSKQLRVARMGICMSSETMERLVAAGIPRERLTFVNPAHDQVLRPRKIVAGITSKTQSDGRKKEDELLRICEGISPDYVRFRIMGAGWEFQVEAMKRAGFEVDYMPRFDREKYLEMIPGLDYYLYFSWDEGSMGFLDAVAAGVKTIVTPQGFHLDLPGGLTYPASNADEIIRILNQATEEVRSRHEAAQLWNWPNYALKHLGIWEYLLGRRESLPEPFFEKLPQAPVISRDRLDMSAYRAELRKNSVGHVYHMLKDRLLRLVTFRRRDESAV